MSTATHAVRSQTVRDPASRSNRAGAGGHAEAKPAIARGPEDLRRADGLRLDVDTLVVDEAGSIPDLGSAAQADGRVGLQLHRDLPEWRARLQLARPDDPDRARAADAFDGRRQRGHDAGAALERDQEGVRDALMLPVLRGAREEPRARDDRQP